MVMMMGVDNNLCRALAFIGKLHHENGQALPKIDTESLALLLACKINPTSCAHCLHVELIVSSSRAPALISKLESSPVQFGKHSAHIVLCPDFSQLRYALWGEGGIRVLILRRVANVKKLRRKAFPPVNSMKPLKERLGPR